MKTERAAVMSSPLKSKHGLILLLVAFGLSVALASTVVYTPASNAAFPTIGTDGKPFPSLAPMLEEVSPCVVIIATYANVKVANPLLDDPYFRRFFNVPDLRRSFRRTKSAGSGVVVYGGGRSCVCPVWWGLWSQAGKTPVER